MDKNPKFFDVSVKVMRVLGIWYDRNTNVPNALLFLCVHLIVILTLVILELIFVFVSMDYIECIKTIGIINFHVICVIKIINSIRVEKRLQKALELIMRNSMRFEMFFPNEDVKQKKIAEMKKKFESYQSTANYFCFLMLTLFILVSQSSLVVSYINALTKTSVQSGNGTAGVMPYNHYHLLDTSKRRNFVIESLFQAYAIMYMTFTFICETKIV